MRAAAHPVTLAAARTGLQAMQRKSQCSTAQ